MNQTQLGKTGLSVSRLGFGGLFVASFATQFADAQRAVACAVELGINYFDTAPGYGNSEEVLGQALRGMPHPVILSTKLGGRPQPFNPQNKAGLRASVEESLRLLGREHIDLLMIHEPDRPGQYAWWTDMVNVTGPVLELLDELKAEGKIRFTGLGGTTTTEMAHLCRSGKFDVVLTAFNFSLLYREAALEVFPAARAAGMGVIVGSPLQQGALARRYDQELDSPAAFWISQARREQFKALYRLSDECGLSLPELGIRFVLSHPAVDCVLMGARSVAEVKQNVAATERGPLPADLLRRLDEIAARVPYRPFGEPFGLGWHLGNPAGYKGQGAG
ncbi:MAG: NADH-specific methylglyoxal reductase [Verrucomicrobiae bacterium]|nr:NADH-specific methylglyoxal reductase [Verrucomicrobiae bacterium]